MDRLYECTSYINERQGNQVVIFDLHVGSGAVAQLKSDDSVVSSITVTNAGAGYTSAPSVAVAGAATATATLGTIGPVVVGTGVKEATVTKGGSGYSSAPSVTIVSPGGSGTTATATSTISTGRGGGAVTGVNITNSGSGYTSAPYTGAGTLTFGSGAAEATAVLTATGISSVTVTDDGSGYTLGSPPAVTFQSAGGTDPEATAVLTTSLKSGTAGVIISDPHEHPVDSAPDVSFTGGGGSGAAGSSVISADNIITGVNVTNGGSGYTSAPIVLFDAPSADDFTITLQEPLRIDTPSEIYLDQFTTVNCVDPAASANNVAFILTFNEFKVKSESNNSQIAFGRVTVPNNGKPKVSHTTGLAVHKASKMNYICQVNPMTIRTITLRMTTLDGSTSIFMPDSSGDHRVIGELVIVPQKTVSRQRRRGGSGGRGRGNGTRMNST